MWAVSSIPSQASWPPPPTTTTKSPRAHGPVTVSAKPRRQSVSLNNHFHDDDDQSVNTPISKKPKQVKSEEIDSDVRSQEEEEEGKVNPNDWDAKEKQLGVGGSDILWALQKAFAQKQQPPTTTPKVNKQQKKKKKKGEIPASTNTKGGGGRGGGDAEKRNGERDCVKPLSIRSDWSKRLDDLESRLGDLTPHIPNPNH